MNVTNLMTWHEVLTLSEQLSLPEQIQLITELSLRVRGKMSAADDQPVDLLDLAGVGREVWAAMDTDDYINRERDSWEQ